MFLTIFTPTYNRAKLLFRLYKSLCSQSSKNFEWLIIDDGSNDDTEQVVSLFIAEQKLNIRYIKKENGGKHTAHNRAIAEANGELFFCVDSDDWLVPNAVELIETYSKQLQHSDYAIVGYKSLENGTLLCREFRNQAGHIGFYSLAQQGITGEFSIVMKTDAIRKKPFPVIAGEKFSTEAVLYDAMDLEDCTVCPCPHVLTVCEYQEDGLTSNIYASLANNPTAYQIYHMQRIDLVKSSKERARHAIQYQAFRHLSKNSDYLYAGKHCLLVRLAYLPGLLGAFYYQQKLN